MKKYNVFELSVGRISRGNGTYQYFICKQDSIKTVYTEIFTDDKIVITDPLDVEPLSNYYSLLAVCNWKTKKPLMLTKKELLQKYNEINYVNLLLQTDNETIENELESRGIFEESKIYKKS